MIGRTLSHYRIVSKLGEGGMGVVYEAVDTELGRKVALKVLPVEMAAEPERLERFRNEARAVAALDHPNIVTIYSIEEVEGVRFFTMELVVGETLERLIVPEGLDLDRFMELALPITEALAAAHERGIVHRDLKPTNIMVTGDSRVKILDFGLAKLLQPELAPGRPQGAPLTEEGTLLGTVPYMSPEQVQGRDVDHRSDLFSLGVIFFEMLTGRKPFRGETVALIASILRDDPPALGARAGNLPQELEAILGDCLQKQPESRCQSAADLLAGLQGLGKEVAARGSAAPAAVVSAPLPLGRKASARRSWKEAFELLRDADATEELAPEDLDRYAEAAFWTRHMDECIGARSRAYAGYLKRGMPGPAALIAILLAEDHFHRLAGAVGNGWLNRAERLLTGREESIEYGYLTRMKARLACECDGDLVRGLELAEQTLEIATRFHDRDLQVLALQDRGRIMVLGGRVEEGMALLDEAMAAAVGGELSPIASGRTYCNMLDTCERLADYRRAHEWSEAAEEWCRDYIDSGFPGICRVHRSGIQRRRGDWEGAEEEARRASEELRSSMPDVAGEAYYQMGEILLLRGDLSGAEKTFDRAHEFGREPLPGLALLRLREGRVDAARVLIEGALEESAGPPLNRSRLLAARVEILLAAGDLDLARSTVEEMEAVGKDYGSPALRAAAEHARGSVELAVGSSSEASASLRAAARLWRDAGLPYEGALSRFLLAQAYQQTGNLESARLELRAARSAFERLGAERDLNAVDASLSADSLRSDRPVD